MPITYGNARYLKMIIGRFDVISVLDKYEWIEEWRGACQVKVLPDMRDDQLRE